MKVEMRVPFEEHADYSLMLIAETDLEKTALAQFVQPHADDLELRVVFAIAPNDRHFKPGQAIERCFLGYEPRTEYTKPGLQTLTDEQPHG
jgi:hypothetical protein